MNTISDEIKAKIVIEADTSGATEAAAALEKLQGMAGDGSIGDALAQQFAKGEEGAKSLTEALGGSEEALKANEEASKASGEATGAVTQAIEEQAQAAGDLQSAHEDLQPAIEDTSKSMASMQETLAKSTPVVSQAAENMAAFQDAMVNPEPFNMVQQYLSETGQSWGDFIESVGPENANHLVNAQNYLNGVSNGFVEANKSVGTFTDTMTSTQSAMDEFNQANPWAGFATGAQDAGKAVEQVDTAINKFGGVGSSQYGPLTFADTLSAKWKTSASEAAQAVEQMGGVEGSLGKVFSTAGMEMGNAFMGLSSWVMPLMAFQMVGTMVTQVGQSIYDAAAVAEGPAAHSMGSFTGSVDALTQSAQKAGETFSESFGRQIVPTLDAINYQMNQGGGTGGIGGILGGTTAFLANAGLILGGLTTIGMNPTAMDMIKMGGEGLINQGADWLGLQEPFQGPPPQQQAQIKYQQSFAQLPQTVAGSALQGQLNADTMIQEGLDPNYLASQQHSSYAQQFLQEQQIRYDSSHPYSAHQALMDYRYAQDTQAEQQAYQSYQTNPPTYGQDMGSEIQRGDWGGLGQTLHDAIFGPSGGPTGIGSFFGGIGDWFSHLLGPADPGGSGAGGFFATGGCFVAGTLVLMADGSEKPIEQLQKGEQIIGHNGIQQEPVVVLSCITYLHKQTYELTFSDGNTLTTTDSHPLYSPLQGWKSLSPASTKRENPHLPVSTLQVGDTIATTQGTCTLVAIEEKQITQVYNISVSGSHTYYANGILVHNPKMGASMGAQSIGDMSGGFQMPHIDMGAIASNLGSQFSGIQLPHLDLGGIASSLGGSFSGIQLPHLDLGGIASGLGGAFSGIQLPHLDLGGIASSLGGAFSGIQLPHLDLGGIASNLGGAFSGIQLPHLDLGGIASNLGGAFSSIQLPHLDLSGISSSLSGAFSNISIPSIPNIGGQISGQLSSMFSGITIPSIPDIGGMINGALGGMFGGITMPSIPDIGGMINGALGGMFSGITMPNIPDIGGMINGAISGIFSAVHMPQIPDFGSMINGAISGIFASIHIPSIPGFASGVEGFSGGLAVVGEAGPELVALPGGSSVYPMSTNMSGGLSPVSLGGSGSGGGHTANISIYLGNQLLTQMMGMSLASDVHISTGNRAF